MGHPIVRFAAIVAAMSVGAVACGIGTSEVVGSTRQRLTPTTYDLPDHENLKIKTSFRTPGGGTLGEGEEYGFCFFLRLRGPFIGQEPYDSKNNPNLDTFASIVPVSNVFEGEISPGMEASFGCVPLTAFDNAGTMASEAGYSLHTVSKTGDGFPINSGAIPVSRTPSFCTLNYVKANFFRPYGNCTSNAYVYVANDTTAVRTTDAAIAYAKGVTCNSITYPPFCVTCPPDQPSYESHQVVTAGCLTKWADQPGTYHLVKFGPVDIASTTSGYGTQLMAASAGVCWISGVIGLGGAWGASGGGTEEEATVSVHNSGGTDYWYVHSTTAGTAKASCILTDQN